MTIILCEKCGQEIEYVFGWRHIGGEMRGHRARPKSVEYAPCWPILINDDQVLLLTSGGEPRLERW